MNKSLRIALGVAISSLCIWLAFRNTNWDQLKLAVLSAEWKWFIPITAVYLCAHMLRCVRWSYLLSPVKKVSPLTLFPLLMMGFLVNNVLPARAGEIARAFAASKKIDVPVGTTIGSIAMERITDLAGLATVMAISLMVIPVEKIPIGKVLVFIGIGLAGIAGMIWFVRTLQKRVTPDESSLLFKISRLLTQLIEGFSALKSPFKVALIIGLSISIWMIEASCLMMASRAFGLHLAFTQTNALLSGISMGVMIPAAPGYIGTYEFFGTEMLKLLGFAAELGLPFLLSFHFYQMLLCSVLGIPGLIRFGLPEKK